MFLSGRFWPDENQAHCSGCAARRRRDGQSASSTDNGKTPPHALYAEGSNDRPRGQYTIPGHYRACQTNRFRLFFFSHPMCEVFAVIEIPCKLLESDFSASIVATCCGPRAAGIFRFAFRRQPITSEIDSHPRAWTKLPFFIGNEAPLIAFDTLLLAQPVAVLRRLEPCHFLLR
jgi:hypothetical protein